MAFKGCVNPLVLDIPDLVLICTDCQLLQKQLQCDEGRHVYHSAASRFRRAPRGVLPGRALLVGHVWLCGTCPLRVQTNILSSIYQNFGEP